MFWRFFQDLHSQGSILSKSLSIVASKSADTCTQSWEHLSALGTFNCTGIKPGYSTMLAAIYMHIPHPTQTMTTHVRTPPKQVFGSAWSLLLSLSPSSPTPCLSFPQQHVRSELSFANASISVQIHLAEDLRWDPQFLLVGIFEAIQERCNSANLGLGWLGRRLKHDCIVQSKSKHCWVLAILGYTRWTLRASSDILSDCMPLSIVKSQYVSSYCKLY